MWRIKHWIKKILPKNYRLKRDMIIRNKCRESDWAIQQAIIKERKKSIKNYEKVMSWGLPLLIIGLTFIGA